MKHKFKKTSVQNASPNWECAEYYLPLVSNRTTFTKYRTVALKSRIQTSLKHLYNVFRTIHNSSLYTRAPLCANPNVLNVCQWFLWWVISARLWPEAAIGCDSPKREKTVNGQWEGAIRTLETRNGADLVFRSDQWMYYKNGIRRRHVAPQAVPWATLNTENIQQ